MKGTTKLRQLLNQPGMLVAPGAHDVMTARLVETEGFQTVYLGGSLLLDSRVLANQQLNERTQQRFASLADVVNKLEKTQIKREFLL